jgi:hypothetical protein
VYEQTSKVDYIFTKVQIGRIGQIGQRHG